MPPFHENERHEGDHTERQRAHDLRVAPAFAGRLDERVHRAAQAQRREQSACPVHSRGGCGVSAFRHAPVCERENAEPQWNVDEKRVAPGKMINQETAEHRPERRRHRAVTRPRADGLAALVAGERRADDGEAARHQQRPAGALHSTRDDQLLDARCQAAPQRRRREQHHADGEHAPAPEVISRGTAGQEQRPEKKRKRLHDPLRVGHGCAESCLQSRQRDVDHGAVDEDHAGRENRGGEDPGPDLRRTGDRRWRTQHDSFVTRRLCAYAHPI